VRSVLLIVLVFCPLFSVSSVLLIVLAFCVVLCFVCLRPVSCAYSVVCFSGLFILDGPSVFSDVYLHSIFYCRFQIPVCHFPALSSFMTYYRICNYINTTGAPQGI
jgi:hypothetical protein